MEEREQGGYYWNWLNRGSEETKDLPVTVAAEGS